MNTAIIHITNQFLIAVSMSAGQTEYERVLSAKPYWGYHYGMTNQM
jgi:hypothetical protein